MNVITDRNHGNYHQGVESDPWLRAFFSNICDRPSCHACHFRKQHRVSDFTIWDCFHAGRFSKKLDNDKGATRILVHSEKGKRIFDAIKEDIEKRDYEDMHRAISPLKQADDAELVDTSDMNIEQVVAALSKIIDDKKAGR